MIALPKDLTLRVDIADAGYFSLPFYGIMEHEGAWYLAFNLGGFLKGESVTGVQLYNQHECLGRYHPHLVTAGGFSHFVFPICLAGASRAAQD